MSEENKEVTQTTTQENSVKNPSTQAEEQNVPLPRFQEVNQQKNDALEREGKLQAQIDKMNQTTKDKQQAELIEQGKYKESLEIVTKERDQYKAGHDQYIEFKATKKEELISRLTDKEDIAIATGLGDDLINLEKLVNKVTNTNAPSTSQARATSGKTAELGGYSSYSEWAAKDPKGYEAANNVVGANINLAFTREDQNQ